jgi:hypothetical protein
MVVDMPTAPLPHDVVVAVARPIVERIVWCTVTTVSSNGVPRSRLMHPVWFWDGDAPVALVTARPTPIKVRHLAAHPGVACLYWDPAHDTVAIDATATWLDPAERRDAWRRIADAPPPVGFDPSIVWPEGPDAADCGFLQFRAHRIVATPAGRPGIRWTARCDVSEAG